MGPFVITFFITLFILVMQFMWVYIDDMVGKGLETIIILELLFFAMANLIPMALPLAVLLSSIMTFGNLGENYELVALKSSGMSLQRIMSPLIVFMVLLSLGAFYFSNSIWPKANLKFASILHDVRTKKPAFDIQDNVFYKEIDGFVIHVKHRDKETDVLHDITIYDHTDKRGNTRVIKAEQGQMRLSGDKLSLIFTLQNGFLYDELPGNKNPLYRSEFSEKQLLFDLSGFKLQRTDEELFKNNYKMMNLLRLARESDTLNKRYKERIQEFKQGMFKSVFYTKDSLNLDTSYSNFSLAEGWFEQLPKEKKLQYMNWATNVVRSSRTYADSFEQDLKVRKRGIKRVQIEWHRKFTLSIACLILFFIGAPLGAIIRKGGLGMPVVISIIFFLIFHMTSITGEKMAKTGVVDVWLGMWLSSMILLPIGMFLTYKATTDSAILDSEFYKNFLGKLTKIKFINNWVNRGKSKA
jgi:lipopolysaccharide export system permease protein